MSEAPVLYKLQTVDLGIEETERLLPELQAKLGETEEVVNARSRRRDVEDQLQASEKARREADDEIEDLSAKIKPLETKLYGGSVKNPKELSSLEKDIDSLKQRRSKAEDTEIDLMTKVEELQTSVKVVREEVGAVEEEWQRSQAALAQEQGQLESRLAELQSQRTAILPTISRPALQMYEGLRKTKRGRAVAKVEQNTCQVCRVSLPMAEVQRARANQQLAFCGSCGRIMWVTR